MRRWLIVVLVAALVAVVARYPRQIRSRLTHWKAGPRRRVSYTALDSPAVRIAAVGDFGYPGHSVDRTGATMQRLGAARPYDALLLLGDHAYPRGEPRLLERTVFRPFGAVLDQGTQLLAVLGNHDVHAGHGDEQLRVLGQSGHWWAREFGPLLLVGLDVNPPVDPAQLKFLDETLAASRAQWRVVAMHYPPYSAGYQGSHLATRELVAPILERHGVQLVLTGHDHDYQRSVPINGVTYVVSGGGARARLTGTKAFTAVAYRVRHFVEVAASTDALTLRAIDQDGQVFDEFVQRTCATSRRDAPSLPGGDQVPRLEAAPGSGPR